MNLFVVLELLNYVLCKFVLQHRISHMTGLTDVVKKEASECGFDCRYWCETAVVVGKDHVGKKFWSHLIYESVGHSMPQRYLHCPHLFQLDFLFCCYNRECPC